METLVQSKKQTPFCAEKHCLGDQKHSSHPGKIHMFSLVLKSGTHLPERSYDEMAHNILKNIST